MTNPPSLRVISVYGVKDDLYGSRYGRDICGGFVTISYLAKSVAGDFSKLSFSKKISNYDLIVILIKVSMINNHFFVSFSPLQEILTALYGAFQRRSPIMICY